MSLIYRLVIRKSTVFVQLQIQGSRRIVYLDTLKSLAVGKEAAALQCLIKIHLRANGGHSIDTLSFKEIALPPAGCVEALRLLVATGKLYFQDVVLQNAPMPARISWKGDLHSPQSATIGAFLDQIPLEKVEVLFPGWAIALNRWIEVQATIAWKWIELFQKGPVTLEGVQKKRFLEENPPILWSKKETAPVITVIPRLVLLDATGSFANLFMDYPGIGSVAFEDLAPQVGKQARLKKDEVGWEQDLLEAGFQRKLVGTSRYYCASEKVADVLQFLLELGWRCTNMQNKSVLLQSGCSLDISEREESIDLCGAVQFEGKEGLAQNVVNAAQKGRLFVELDEHHVGLLDRKNCLPFPQGAWEGNHLSLPKTRVGELLPLLPQPEVSWSEALKMTLTALENKEGFASSPLDDRFQGTLLPYQEQGVQWLSCLYRQGLGALLSDEMGLGKTVQVLAFFSQLRTNLPILIVAPTSLIFNWEREIAKFWPQASVYVHAGPGRLQDPALIGAKPVILTSYAMLRIDQEIFAPIVFEAIALDESQTIKSSKSQIAQAAYQLQAKFRIAITGTPIENRPEELWSQFRFLMPQLLGDTSSFLSTPHKIKGLRIKPFILMRKKEQVQIHLPEKIDRPLWVEMTEEQKRLYDETLSALQSGLLPRLQAEGIQNHRFEVLAAILRLRQICLDPRLVGEDLPGAKAEIILSMVQEWVDSGKKALIFSQFTTFLRILQTDLQKIGIEPLYLDGSIPAKDRGEIVRKFQEEEKPHIFLLSLKAGGVGLNLTAAQSALLLEPWWNEAAEQQAIDRAHRIGQKNALWIHRLLTPNAIEEKMLGVKGRKMAFADEILSGAEEAWSAEDLTLLLK